MTLWQWIRATWVGWLGGILLVVLFALLGEAIGIGGAHALVGAGIGAAVGISQGRALRAVLDRTAPWLWSCAIGLTVPLLLSDILRATGHDSRYALHLAVAVGGINAGVWQAYLLRAHTPRPAWWVAASGIGWTLAAASAVVADALFRAHAIRGLAGAATYLGITAMGGLVLGATTGVALVRLLQLPPHSNAAT